MVSWLIYAIYVVFCGNFCDCQENFLLRREKFTPFPVKSEKEPIFPLINHKNLFKTNKLKFTIYSQDLQNDFVLTLQPSLFLGKTKTSTIMGGELKLDKTIVKVAGHFSPSNKRVNKDFFFRKLHTLPYNENIIYHYMYFAVSNEEEIVGTMKVQEGGIISMDELIKDRSYLKESSIFTSFIFRNEKKRKYFAKNVAKSILSALNSLHEWGIIHLDVTMSNILFVNENDEIIPKLNDFKMAQEDCYTSSNYSIDGSKVMIGGDPRYISPEMSRRECFTGKHDIFQFGHIFYFLLTDEHFIKEEDVPKVEKFNSTKEFVLEVQKMLKKKYNEDGTIKYFPSILTEEEKEILNKMLHEKESERLTAKELLEQKYFQNLKKMKIKDYSCFSDYAYFRVLLWTKNGLEVEKNESKDEKRTILIKNQLLEAEKEIQTFLNTQKQLMDHFDEL